MLIRAVGRQLAGLEEPERRQETWSYTVMEKPASTGGEARILDVKRDLK